MNAPVAIGTFIIGDTIGTTIGWLTASYIDNLGNKYGWYDLHIKNSN